MKKKVWKIIVVLLCVQSARSVLATAMMSDERVRKAVCQGPAPVRYWFGPGWRWSTATDAEEIDKIYGDPWGYGAEVVFDQWRRRSKQFRSLRRAS